jgi:cytochrome c oxidase subunit 2
VEQTEHNTTPPRPKLIQFLTSLLLAGSAFALLAPAAQAFTVTTPEGASPNAHAIHEIYVLALAFSLAIFLGVWVSLGWCLWRYRARKRHAEGAQIHGNTRLEVGWTLGAAGVLVVLAVFTFVKLGSIIDPQNSGPEGEALLERGPLYALAERKLPPSGKRLEINVVGRQYVWQFVYPGGTGPAKFGPTYSYEEMVVPTETTVVLNVTAADVVHSWWVPALGGKVQAVPGYHNYTWFKISKPGVFHGQCATLCGRDHARMIATVRAVPPAQFEAWLAERKRDLEIAGEEAAKARAKMAQLRGPQSVENP